ncbi:T9SS type A sorting domain-containing protein [Taibaiella soli]|nr:T9SS type A sorting domain-containing protein [Taibaiella soli]
MKKAKLLLSFSTLLLCVGISRTATAQFTSDSLNNTKIRDTTGLNAMESKMVTAPNGNSFITWAEANTGSSGLQTRIQLIDSNGNKLWGAKGLLVDSLHGSALFRSDLKVDTGGNAIIATQDQRSGSGINWPVIFKVDQSGNFVWGAGGIQLRDTVASASSGLGPVVTITPTNNVLVAWGASGSKSYISYQKFDPNGTMIWQKEIIDPATSSPKKYERPQIVISDGDVFIMQYVQRSGSGLGVSTMYAQKFDGSGSPVWATPTSVSTKNIGFAYFPSPVTDGYGGFFLSFTTGNPASNTISDVFAQRVYSDGHTWNTDGYELITGTTTQRFEAGNMFSKNANKYFANILLTSSSQGQQAIYLQKVDTSGALAFPGGLQVVPLSSGQNADAISINNAVNMDTGVVIVYSVGTQPAPTTIFATKVGYSGTFPWSIPVKVSVAQSNKSKVVAGAFIHKQIVVSWIDTRLSSGGVYAQNIRFNGYLGIEPPCNISIAPATLTPSTVGNPYTTNITQTGATGFVTFAVTTGTLPSGLSLSSAGALAGTDTISGPYTFTVTVTDSVGCSATKTYTLDANCPAVTLANLPTGKTDVDPAFTLTGGSPAGGTYSGTGVSNGQFNPGIAGAGTFTIQYTYTFGNCTDSASKTITVAQPAGVKTVTQADVFSCFPNPAKDAFTVQLKQNISGDVTIRICSIDGRAIMTDQQHVSGNGYNKTFDMTGYAKGIYLIEVNTTKGKALGKIIVE